MMEGRRALLVLPLTEGEQVRVLRHDDRHVARARELRELCVRLLRLRARVRVGLGFGPYPHPNPHPNPTLTLTLTSYGATKKRKPSRRMASCNWCACSGLMSTAFW